MLSWRTIGSATLAVAISSGVFKVRAEDEIEVGRSAAGQLKVQVNFELPLPLEASVFPGIGGYAIGELGVHSTTLDNPTNDFLALPTGGNFRFILVAKDPGTEVWNDTGSGFMEIGEPFRLGPAPFDTHPIWNIANGTGGRKYSLTLKFRDLSGNYADSDPFVLSFTPLQYQLDILPLDSLHATLSWTTNAVGWELQSAASVGMTNWQTVTNVTATVGTNFSLDISLDGTNQFFRLFHGVQ